MSQLSDHHKALTDGKGKCSVPMWCNGMPAGFCDQDAYGEETAKHRRRALEAARGPYAIPATYVPALACPGHGGPEPTQTEEKP